MRVVFFIFLLSIFASTSLYAQKDYQVKIDSLNNKLELANDTIQVQILDQLVEKYFYSDQNDKMYAALKEMEELSHAINYKKGLFRTYYYYGIVSFHIEWQPTISLKHLYRSLEIGSRNNINHPITYSGLYNNLGLVYKNMEMYDSALYFYEKAAYVNEAYHLDRKNISLFLNMSRINYQLGNSYQHLKYASKGLEVAKKIEDDKAICAGYRIMAEALHYYDSPELAIEYCKKALNHSIRFYGKDHSNTASVLGLLSRCYNRVGDYESSLYYAQQNHQYLRHLYGDIHPKLVESYLSFGSNYMHLNQLDSAEHCLLKALESAEKIAEKNNLPRVLALLSLGDYYLLRNNFLESMRFLKMALNHSTVNDSKKMATLRLIGKLYFKSGAYLKSLNSYEEAVSLIVGQPLSGKYKNPTSEEIELRGVDLIRNKAATYEALYNQDHNKEHLVAALSDYLLCDSIISKYRSGQQAGEDRVAFSNSSVKAYQGGVRVAQKLYKILKEDKYLELAFILAEKSKSNLLYQSISQQNALQQAMLPDSILSYGEELKGKINFYMSLVNKNSGDNTSQSNYEDLLFETKRKYENYLQRLESEYPKYYQLKYNHDFLTLQEIQKKLKERVLIEYVLTDESIYIFLVTNRDAKMILVEKPKEFENWISEFRSAIVSKDYQSYRHVAYELYKLVFKPIERHLKKEDQIIVVPDGNLWYLNYDLLLREKGNGRSFQDLGYLVRDYTISYANSANHFFINDDTPRINDAPVKCLAFSYSNSAANANAIDFSVLRNLGDDLPGTRKEIRGISKLMPGKYYYGQQASESTFKEESAKYSILHLALHGEIDNKNPLYSKLHFSKNAKDTLNDGYLNVYEIYNMSLNSQLAVLSACNTGYGKLEKGEGLMSLGRAFQYAGVNSLLLTSWEVADEEAPEIMCNFYRNLKDGMGKSEALRQAKLEYLQTAGMFKSAPFYWGSFVVIGDTCPVEIEDESFGYWMYLIAIIPLMIIGLMVYKRIR